MVVPLVGWERPGEKQEQVLGEVEMTLVLLVRLEDGDAQKAIIPHIVGNY